MVLLMNEAKRRQVNNMVPEGRNTWHDVAANLGHTMRDGGVADSYKHGDKIGLLDKQEKEYQQAMVLGELKHQIVKVENSRVRRVRVDALCKLVDTLDTFIIGEGETDLLREDDEMDREKVGDYLSGAKIAVKRSDMWSVLGKKVTFLVQQCLKDREEYWNEFNSDNAKQCTMEGDVIRKSHQAIDDELWYVMMLYCRALSMFPEIMEEAMQARIYKNILETIIMDIDMLVQYELEERTAVSCIEAIVGLQEHGPLIYVELVKNERFIEQILESILGNSLVPEQVRIAAAKAVIVMMQDTREGKSTSLSPEAIIQAENYSKAENARLEAKDYISTRLSKEGAMLITSSSVVNNNKNDSSHLERRASALAMLLLHTYDVE
jgi:hypothetical protein